MSLQCVICLYGVFVIMFASTFSVPTMSKFHSGGI